MAAVQDVILETVTLFRMSYPQVTFDTTQLTAIAPYHRSEHLRYLARLGLQVEQRAIEIPSLRAPDATRPETTAANAEAYEGKAREKGMERQYATMGTPEGAQALQQQLTGQPTAQSPGALDRQLLDRRGAHAEGPQGIGGKERGADRNQKRQGQEHPEDGPRGHATLSRTSNMLIQPSSANSDLWA